MDNSLNRIRSFKDQNGDTQVLIDSDTLLNKRTGERTRVTGFDGLETGKLIQNSDGSFELRRGELGGDLNTQVVADVIDQGGFTNIINTGKEDDYDRSLAPLMNDNGEMISDVLYKEGLAKLDRFSSEKNVTLKREGEMYRALFGDRDSLFAKQRKELDAKRDSQGLLFKSLALDESTFDPNFHSGVQFRDHDRTIDNKPKGLLSGAAYSFGTGWDSIKEGAFGYLEAIGEMSDVEMLENLGAQGAMRARSQIANTPELLLNYDQVENLSTGFQWVMNNAAMSAPYMITTFAALAAAIPASALVGGGAVTTGALALLPTSVIYAGQTWNEMEGEKGISQFVAASMSGVGQASLELLGLRGLVVPVQVFSAAGKKKIVEALMARGLDQEQATRLFASKVGKAQREFFTGLVRLKPDDIAGFSKSSLGKATMAGMARESLTEVGQESLAMGTAAGFSDTTYDADEVKHRLTNAALAGGVLGGGIGAGANTYMQGRNRLEKASRNRRDLERLSLFELYKIGRMQSGEGVATIQQNLDRDNAALKGEDPTLPDLDLSGVTTVDEAIARIEAARKLQLERERTATMSDKELTETLEGKPSTNQKNEKGEFRYASPLREAELTLESIKETARDQGVSETDPKYIQAVKEAEANVERARAFEARVRQEIEGRRNGTRRQLSFEEADAAVDAGANSQTELARLQQLKADGIVSYTPASEFNKTGSLANEYIAKRKGMRNVIRNIESVSDLVDALAVGTGRLVRGAERAAIKAARAVANPIVLDILSRIGGTLGDVVHSGQNAKEFQQEIITKAKILLDELTIAKSFGRTAMRWKDALNISRALIEFGRSGGYWAYNAYQLQAQQPNLNKVIQEAIDLRNQMLSNTLTEADRADAQIAYDLIVERLALIGFSKDPIIFAEELAAYQRAVAKYADADGLIKLETLAQFLEGDIKPEEMSQAMLAELERNFLSAERIKRSYDYVFSRANEEYKKENKEEELSYDIDMWWLFQGFNWKAARKNPVGFKKMLVEKLDYSATDAQRIYESISRRGEQTINPAEVGVGSNTRVEYSLVDPNTTGVPFAFSKDARKLMDAVRDVLPSSKWTYPYELKIDPKTNKPNLEGKGKRKEGVTRKQAKADLSKEEKSFFSMNIFATLNKVQLDAARYTANARYFGQGGWKLHRLFRRLEREGDLTRDELIQFAFYIRSMINAMNGNYNRIENPRAAALNSFATSWSVLAGLPLSMPASLPEFGMVYFDIKDDQMFKQATDQMVRQVTTSFSKALDSEANRGRRLADSVGLDSSINNIADRLATGERDVAFARVHEVFFKGTGIQTITQLQRRIVAVVALDAIKTAFAVLETAPTKLYIKGKEKPKAKENVVINDEQEIAAEARSIYNFDFDKFTEAEMGAYNQLTSLGINVDRIMILMEDLDSMSRNAALTITDGVSSHLRKETVKQGDDQEVEVIRPPTQREAAIRKIVKNRVRSLMQEGEFVSNDQALNEDYAHEITETAEYITDELSNAIQRYVHERIQMPGHGNRPLFFQDPHFQLITQFNGFISAFTANIIPKLYDRALRRGNIKVKYETFALIMILLVLGAASQYIKDLAKFGAPSPYLDTSGYIQRAVYASGVMGQFERVADIVHPLYPQRDEGVDWLMNAVLGESGPTVRNVQNVAGGVGDLLQGEGERGVRNILKATPLIGPFTGPRSHAAQALTGTNPYKGMSPPTDNEIKDFFLGSY